jgi:hypothetical protein
MDKLAKLSWPSTDTLVIIVSLTVIGVGIWIVYCPLQRSGDARQTKPTRPPLVPGCWGSASVVGYATTYHRLRMWNYVTNM